MFGFKSKKDKRIEELEAMLTMKPHFIETVNKKVHTLKSQTFIPSSEIPIEWVKEDLCRKFTDQLEPFIQFDVVDVDGRHCLTAVLNVVDKF